MHENIKKFSLKGEMGDGNFAELQARHIDFVERQMRDEGFVPCVDNEPQFTRHYRPSTETWDFELTVYGVEVGRHKAWSISGVANGKMIHRTTQPAR
jgi:hypothetical protein